MLLPIFFLWWLQSFFYPSFFYPADELSLIGDKIWKNECAGKIDGLIVWNRGEEFASLGIGHFIWYPETDNQLFKETFPALIAFLKNERVKVPEFFEKNPYCPWKSKEEFEKIKDSEEIFTLKMFLFNTRSFQAKFILERLKKSVPRLSIGLNPDEASKLNRNFLKLSKTAPGKFAMIDYLNFKGEGIELPEQYQGVGWGLKQVLLNMDEANLNPLQAFKNSARKVLQDRVKNSPKARQEELWLRGWMSRIDSY